MAASLLLESKMFYVPFLLNSSIEWRKRRKRSRSWKKWLSTRRAKAVFSLFSFVNLKSRLNLSCCVPTTATTSIVKSIVIVIYKCRRDDLMSPCRHLAQWPLFLKRVLSLVREQYKIISSLVAWEVNQCSADIDIIIGIYLRTKKYQIMELFSRRRWRLVSAQVVSCWVYENTKQ